MVSGDIMNDDLTPDTIERQRYWQAKQRIDSLCRAVRNCDQNNELNQLWAFARDFEQKEEELFEPARLQVREMFGMRGEEAPMNARWDAKPRRQMLD